MGSPTLHAVTSGTSGPRVAFCHGLFGQGRNWTQIAKGLADISRPTLLDMPDHGRSPWTERFDYPTAADIVADNLRAIDPDEPWIVVGHSMGGKIAMLVALRHPELVERLCVVDISPAATTSFSEFETYIAAMQAMDLGSITTREQADAAMREAAPDPGVRAFLLQNLRREGEGWRWQPNLEVIGRDIATIGGWPTDEVAGLAPFDKTVLWLAGERSLYVTDDELAEMRRLFPRVRLVTVKGAGHWVHSEAPEVTLQSLRALITSSR
ncbi:alpha/beta fold hydrolase [Helicobacter pylori]|jgi:pimeloyl-ACP methyl ester carboxylesterase|nr:alpha/beta fold hydrolase [Janibacter sp. CX7]UTT67059.1 alpha/beta fold hydrolase [Janibacter sp. CX7]